MELTGGDGRDGRHVDQDRAGPQALPDPRRSEDRFFDLRCVGNHGDDDVAMPCDLLRVVVPDRACALEAFDRFGASVNGRMECVARAQQARAHWFAHGTDTDQSDVMKPIHPYDVRTSRQPHPGCLRPAA